MLSMYQACVPVFQRYLGNLSALLDKAEAHAAAKQIEPAALLQARLFPDMFPLLRQVQITADFAKRTCAPLAGVEIPRYEDREQNFADLRARIARTQDFIGTLRPEQFEGSAEREIVERAGLEIRYFKGDYFLSHFALPNFYFHLMSVYAILRYNGVAIGKSDFDGLHTYLNPASNPH